MNITLNIGENLIDQFQKVVAAKHFDKRSGYALHKIKSITFPDQVEFYHFEAVTHNIPIHMLSTNAKDSDWYLIHINIGSDTQLKKEENRTEQSKKFVPSGILLYCPGIRIKTEFPTGHKSELASIRFPKKLLHTYYKKGLIQDGQLLVYEDLDSQIEQQVRAAIASLNNKLGCHAQVLKIMADIFTKIESTASTSNNITLHNTDITNLLRAASYLTNPTVTPIPSIKELANIAQMSASKFKVLFKQFFGRAPYQYHFRVKMEYAKKELIMGRKTPLTLSQELDYAHPSNFTSAYKNYFGTLPSSDYSNS